VSCLPTRGHARSREIARPIASRLS
jgi:hypothetical protein